MGTDASGEKHKNSQKTWKWIPERQTVMVMGAACDDLSLSHPVRCIFSQASLLHQKMNQVVLSLKLL